MLVTTLPPEDPAAVRLRDLWNDWADAPDSASHASWYGPRRTRPFGFHKLQGESRTAEDRSTGGTE